MYFICLTSTIEMEKKDSLLETLLSKIGREEKDALCELYQQTKSDIYGFSLSILKNTHDAEDVMQETYLHIFASAKDYKPQGKPMAWILTITRNLCLMKLREQAKKMHFSEENWENYWVNSQDLTSEDKLLLLMALKSLSKEECQIVVLHAVSGFKHREIAKLLELPLPTVLSKYHRAVKKMKVLFMEGK